MTKINAHIDVGRNFFRPPDAIWATAARLMFSPIAFITAAKRTASSPRTLRFLTHTR